MRFSRHFLPAVGLCALAVLLTFSTPAQAQRRGGYPRGYGNGYGYPGVHRQYDGYQGGLGSRMLPRRERVRRSPYRYGQGATVFQVNDGGPYWDSIGGYHSPPPYATGPAGGSTMIVTPGRAPTH